MTKQVELAYQFDFVHDGQKVFRELLSAVANPGTIRDISTQVKKFNGVYAALTALGCTLLDNEEIMYVEKNPALAAELHDLTLCREGSLEQADYIFLSSEMNYGSLEEIMRNVKKGTYADPQESATIIILCNQMKGDVPMTLFGPGIKDKLTVKVQQYIKTILSIRQSLEIEYPLGIDLVFATAEGELMGIPRLCRISEERDNSER